MSDLNGSLLDISLESWGIDAQLATIAFFSPIPLNPFQTFGGTFTKT